MKILTGVIHGHTIELDDNPGLPDGETVEVQVVVKRIQKWGEGLRRCAGILAEEWSEEDERILQQIEQDRQIATYRELPE